MSSISVVICTYNPDLNVLDRCLQSIKQASEVFSIHEIVIIDNNSQQALHQVPFLSSFLQSQPYTKIINESRQGLTYARLCGIQHTTGDLLIFIDDDNFVKENFFFEAHRIARDYQFIGAFSGQVRLVYDSEPPKWTMRYWGMLVHRVFSGDRWGNEYFNNSIMPNGAGLCIRRDVAQFYKQLHDNSKRAFALDRTGNSLMSGGDNDLAMCAIDCKMGMGLFESLEMEHYIPVNRFTMSYLKRLTHGIAFSEILLRHMRNMMSPKPSLLSSITKQLKILTMSLKDQMIQRASIKGAKDGYKYLIQHKINSNFES